MTDLSLLLKRHGYDAIGVDRERRDGDADYESRLLGSRAVVLQSREGARLFYDETVVSRRRAVPAPLAGLLFGRGALHGLDGAAHRRRKLLMVDALSAETLGPLVDSVETSLRSRAAGWAGDDVSLFCELVTVYGEAVQAWAGVPQTGHGAQTSRGLARIVDGFGVGDPATYLRAWSARVRANRWAADVVAAARARRPEPPPGSPLSLVAAADLDKRTAGVELLNILRPSVAVAWLGGFAAVRLDEHAGWRPRLADQAGAMARFAFAQEVRRTTPFAPALAGRVRRRVDALGFALEPGDRLVLDVIGIHCDPERWPDPGRFDPERFTTGVPGAFDLVPQGGGHPSGHRCPGESLTLRLLAATLQVLAEVDYRVLGDPAPDRRRIPALPRCGPKLAVNAGLTQARPAGAGRA
jgi:fatty-acid peroxygenase